jgi:Mn2+/Fe2+ NRAMP family transporter
MTHDPFRTPPGTNPPRYPPVDRAAAMGWTFTVIAAIVVVAGIAFYVTGPVRTPTAANPPAATTDETTGRAAPRLTQ